MVTMSFPSAFLARTRQELTTLLSTATAHDPHSLPLLEYYRQMYWSSGIDLPAEGYEATLERMLLDYVEIPAGEKRVLSLALPKEFVIVFDPVTHAAQFIDVQGEPLGSSPGERRDLSVVFNKVRAPTGTVRLRPGPLRLTLDNRTDLRILPSVCVAGSCWGRGGSACSATACR